MHTQTGGSTALSGRRSFMVHSKGKNEQRLPDPRLFATIKDALPFTRSREVNLYRIRNFVNIWRGFWRIMFAKLLGVPTHYGALYAVVTRGTGEIVNYGLISLRVVTDTGVAYIVDAFQNSVELENMKFHGYGTGGSAEAVGNTGLTTELTTQYVSDNTRPTGSTTEGATANIFRSVGTLDPDADVAITEHGLFSASSAGVLIDRSLFSAINLSGAGGDTLQTTYDLTFTSGG